jgi:hypothetical protein
MSLTGIFAVFKFKTVELFVGKGKKGGKIEVSVLVNLEVK